MTVRTRSEIAAYAIVFAALALLFVRAWRIDYDYSIDFQTYWLAGSRVLHGQAAELYEPGGGPTEGTPVAMGAGEFKNIPLVAVAFAPLAFWDYATAKRIVWWAGLAAIVAAAWLVGRFVLPEAIGPPSVRAALAFAAIAAMAPAHIALRHGQTTPFVAALIAVYLAAQARRRPAIAGIALGIACLVKFPPLALLGLDVARGRFRAVIACLATIATLLVISIGLFGPSLHLAYERGVAAQAGQVMAAHNNQSIVAVTTRFLGEAANRDWSPRPVRTTARVVSEVAAVALLALVGWALSRRTRSGDPILPRLAFEGSAVLALGIVVLPVAWDHYVLMAAPALVAMAAALGRIEERWRRPLLAVSAIAYVLLALPTPGRWIEAEGAPGPILAFALSHYFVGLIAVLGVAVVALRTESAT
jgi:hypothetical protein